MLISVLITTYNRPALLPRAIASVLRQDHREIELVVIDDASDQPVKDIVDDFHDARIRLIRNKRNRGAELGDIAHLRRFLDQYCAGEALLYLCDDDWIIPADLLSRAAAALEANPRLAFVQAGMAQAYDNPIGELVPNADYITYEFIDLARRQVFARGLFPAGTMSGKEFLRLYAADPKNRNIVTGATVYRSATFRQAGALERLDGVRWQGGYAMSAAVAVLGDVLYLDEPGVMTAVDAGSASFRGGQRMHMLDALASIDAAFAPVMSDPDYRDIRDRMARSVIMTYVCNKIGHRLGWFQTHALGDISEHFLPPIPAADFLAIAEQRGVPLSRQNVRSESVV